MWLEKRTNQKPWQRTRRAEWLSRGLGIANALRLVRADFCDIFLSFDQRLKKRTNAAGLSPAVQTSKEPLIKSRTITLHDVRSADRTNGAER